MEFRRNALDGVRAVRSGTASSPVDLFMPHSSHILPGRQVTVDFLTTVKIPKGFMGQLFLKGTNVAGRKLIMHADQLCKHDARART